MSPFSFCPLTKCHNRSLTFLSLLSSLVPLGSFIKVLKVYIYCTYTVYLHTQVCICKWCMNGRVQLLANPIPPVPPFYVASNASIWWLWVAARWDAYRQPGRDVNHIFANTSSTWDAYRQPGRDENHILANTSPFQIPAYLLITYLIHPTTLAHLLVCTYIPIW